MHILNQFLDTFKAPRESCQVHWGLSFTCKHINSTAQLQQLFDYRIVSQYTSTV